MSRKRKRQNFHPNLIPTVTGAVAFVLVVLVVVGLEAVGKPLSTAGAGVLTVAFPALMTYLAKIWLTRDREP